MRKVQVRKSEKGQSLLELAISMTILLILLAGVADVGRMLFLYMSMRDAAQEGAVYGSIYPTFCDQIVDRARTTIPEGYDIRIEIAVYDPASPNVRKTCSEAPSYFADCTGKQMEISVIHDNFTFVGPFMNRIPPFQLKATVTNTILRTCHK